MKKQDLIKVTIISLMMSITCSVVTYFVTKRQIPKFATVDLLYLNNDFITDLSRRKLENGASDEEVSETVRSYMRTLEPLLQEISKSGNLILFQRQAIVTKADDITPQIARALFKNQSNKKNDNEK